jgi:hypothetical protein
VADEPRNLSHGADKSERLQVLLAVLLGAAALATAWAAYRGDLYSGDSVILLNQRLPAARTQGRPGLAQAAERSLPPPSAWP